jgi:deoxyribonuclease I
VPKEILTRFVPLSEKNRKRFEAWDKADPVDDWERERVQRIEAIQGNSNPFVK